MLSILGLLCASARGLLPIDLYYRFLCCCHVAIHQTISDDLPGLISVTIANYTLWVIPLRDSGHYWCHGRPLADGSTTEPGTLHWHYPGKCRWADTHQNIYGWVDSLVNRHSISRKSSPISTRRSSACEFNFWKVPLWWYDDSLYSDVGGIEDFMAMA